jgi:hypothetical protein
MRRIQVPEKHPAFIERVVPRRDFELPPDISELSDPPLGMPDQDHSSQFAVS